MPFEVLDIALVSIMLISGFLAFVRGFTREVLALATWGGGAGAAYLASQSEPLRQLARQYIESEIVANIALVGAVFLVTLIVLSVIAMKLADWILESGVGTVDRALGFIFGLARGLLLVAVAYIFFIYWVSPDRWPNWVRNAQTIEVVDKTSFYVISVLPFELRETLLPRTIEGLRRGGAVTTGKQDREVPAESDDDYSIEDLNRTMQNQQLQQ